VNNKSVTVFHLEMTKIIKNKSVVLLIEANSNRVKCTLFKNFFPNKNHNYLKNFAEILLKSQRLGPKEIFLRNFSELSPKNLLYSIALMQNFIPLKKII
jgi:hypothetical protein